MAKKINTPKPVTPLKKQTAAKSVPAAETDHSPSAHFWWFGIVAAILGFLLYTNTFGHQYALDDYSCLKDNYIVKGGLKNLGTIFSTEYRFGYEAWGSIGSLYRPATLSMFALEWQLSEDNPTLYHFSNVLFFALTGWLLWATWRRILAGYPSVMTALAVLFFMAHPVHTEVVGNIKSRDEIMSLFLCTAALFALWRHWERGGSGWLALSVVFYGMAFFFKESTVTFLAIFPLCTWYFTNKSIGENVKKSALYLIPTAIFLLARHKVLSAQVGTEVNSILDNFIVGAENPASRLASAFMMCWRYFQTLLFPHPLVSDMGYPQLKPVTFGDWQALLGLFLYVGAFVWALLNLRKKHFLSFAILFYLITFSLYSNILIEIGTSYGERLLYVPSLGFAFMLAWGICKVLNINELGNLWNPAGKGTMVWGAALVLVMLYGLKTYTRNPVWYDSFSLYKADIVTSPNCAKLNYHIGLEYAKEGINDTTGVVRNKESVEKALASYTKAMELYPNYHDAYGSRGVAYFRLNDYNKAFDDYQVALKYRPNDAKVLSNMGIIYISRRDTASAEASYRKSVAADPRFVDARRNLGAVLAMQGKFPEAIENWKKGLEIEPKNLTLLKYIASGYRDMGQPDLGKPYMEKYTQLGGN